MERELYLSDIEPVESPSLLGWRVLLTEEVMDACIRDPQRIGGKTMADCVSYLRFFLEYHLRMATGDPSQGRVAQMVIPREHADWVKPPSTAISLSMTPIIDYDGEPCLMLSRYADDTLR